MKKVKYLFTEIQFTIPPTPLQYQYRQQGDRSDCCSSKGNYIYYNCIHTTQTINDQYLYVGYIQTDQYKQNGKMKSYHSMGKDFYISRPQFFN